MGWVTCVKEVIKKEVSTFESNTLEQNTNLFNIVCRYCGYNQSSLSVGHYELCRDDIGDLPGSPEHL